MCKNRYSKNLIKQRAAESMRQKLYFLQDLSFFCLSLRIFLVTIIGALFFRGQELLPWYLEIPQDRLIIINHGSEPTSLRLFHTDDGAFFIEQVYGKIIPIFSHNIASELLHKSNTALESLLRLNNSLQNAFFFIPEVTITDQNAFLAGGSSNQTCYTRTENFYAQAVWYLLASRHKPVIIIGLYLTGEYYLKLYYVAT